MRPNKAKLYKFYDELDHCEYNGLISPCKITDLLEELFDSPIEYSDTIGDYKGEYIRTYTLNGSPVARCIIAQCGDACNIELLI